MLRLPLHHPQRPELDHLLGDACAVAGFNHEREVFVGVRDPPTGVKWWE